MATTFHKLSGECQWAKVSKPGDEKHEKFSIDLFLDAENLKIFNKLKLRNKLKMDDNGRPYTTFSRAFRKKINDEVVEFGEPLLYNADGSAILNDRPLIGNGSKVTIKISVYNTQYEGAAINGHRLEAVKLDELIEYKPMLRTPGSPIEGLPF